MTTQSATIQKIISTAKGFMGTTIYKMCVEGVGNCYTGTKKSLKVGQTITFVQNVKMNNDENGIEGINLRII